MSHRELYSFICGAHGVTHGGSNPDVECSQKASGECRPVLSKQDFPELWESLFPTPEVPGESEEEMK